MPVFNEWVGVAILAAGVAIVTIGLFWLLIRAFRSSIWWGLAVLFIPLIGPLAFIVARFRAARWPLLVIVLGGLVAGSAVALNAIFGDSGVARPLEQSYQGERELNLTGVPDYDYTLLKDKPDLVTLQMANPDVTDATLDHLAGMTKLRELDLTYSKVTDEGLAKLAGLPALEVVRLARTAVTDAGVRTHVLSIKTLKEIDVRGTKVETKTLREWKNADPQVRKYLK
jgi:hypothetical protein